jgi:hypothetical protein
MTKRFRSDLSIPRKALHSLVVFDSGTKFSDELKYPPERCWVVGAHRATDAIDEILSGEPVFSDAVVMEIAYELRKHRIPATEEVRAAHIRGVERAKGRDRVLE